MKNILLTPLFALLLLGSSLLRAQNPDDYLGLPGDNLNLFAVMNLFQESETLEGFERSLNDPEKMINNLDLNGDNYVDYIMVFDYVDGDNHNIVLRVALNQNEYQDVAVFSVWKMNDGSVGIQLIGDEALYGPNYIVEPYYAETPNPGYRGTARPASGKHVAVVHTTHYEVARWPLIVYVYHPGYRVYRSSWYWGYHPYWWNPWTPHYFHFYYGYHYNWHHHYFAYYRPWHTHRHVHYHRVYVTNIRHYSPRVTVYVNSGNYRKTYSKPESRRDGEVLYAQRHARGGNVPASSGVESGRSRSSSATGSESRDRSARVVEQPRSGNAGARSTGATTRENSRGSREATPSRSVERSSSERSQGTTQTAPRSSGSQRSNSGNVNQAPERRQNTQAAPRSSGSSRQSQAAPASQRSSSGNVNQAPARSQNSQAAPARTQQRTESRVQRSQPSAQQKAQPARQTQSRSSSETKSESERSNNQRSSRSR